jgi:glutamate racemase
VIGVYDSGLGGLTVLAALRTAGITADAVYFADQAHVPYGDKTDAELHALLAANLAWLRDRGAGAVVMGCNTSCAVAARLGWPDVAVPHGIADLIVNGAQAFAGSTYARVAVIATVATVRSGAYGNAIRAIAPHVDVLEVAAPALVPLVEAGASESDDARAAVDAVVAGLPADIDAIVYGCTHYPLLDAHFARALPQAARIDPAVQQARAVARLGLASGTSRTAYVTNGDVAAFEANVRRWTGDTSGSINALVGVN